MGNVCSAGLGQAPARQAALLAGLSDSCTCTTINKVCSSGLKSISAAAQDIQLGLAEIVVAGGMENMSLIPYYSQNSRFGKRMGHMTLTDGMIHDGLWDPHGDKHMGMFAEQCASKFEISREEQDLYARQSYQRAAEAAKTGKFRREITAVHVKGRKEVAVVEEDEEYSRTNVEKLAGMKPAFLRDSTGTVTAGNASSINDGAAAVVLMSAAKAHELGVKPLAKIMGYADAEKHPSEFTTSPALAVPRALKRAKLEQDDVDVFEINEAFSVVALANAKLLGLDSAKTNVFGGAVSLGHPLGSSGARIVVTLLNALQDKGGKIGVAAICNGGGGSTAMVISRITEEARL